MRVESIRRLYGELVLRGLVQRYGYSPWYTMSEIGIVRRQLAGLPVGRLQ